MTTDEMNRWDTEDGIRILKKLGVKQRQTVVDFGCGVGHYSIPAALLVGPQGIVYAIDKEKSVLSRVTQKAELLGLSNVKTMTNPKEAAPKFADRSIDVVLLYDMLHFLPGGKRKALYSKMGRALTDAGLLSVHPKHLAGDQPADYFETMNIQDVIAEIEKGGFSMERKINGRMSHDNSIVQGCVLKFRKT